MVTGEQMPVSPLCLAGFDVLRAMSTRTTNLTRPPGPLIGKGWVRHGEGRGVGLEELKHALRRGAHIYGK